MKKLTTLFIAAAVLLSVLSGASVSVSAAESLALTSTKECSVPLTHIDWSMPTIDGKTITKNTYADKTVLYVFFYADMSGGEGLNVRSRELISGLAACDWLGSSGVQVVAADLGDNTERTVRAYKARYAPDCDDIVFAYDGHDAAYSLHAAASASFSYFAMFAVVKNDTLYAAGDASSAEVCQSALSKVSSVPDPYAELNERLEQILSVGSYRQEEARSILTMVNELRTGDDAWYWNYGDTEKVYLTGLEELTYDYALEQIAMRRAAELVLSFGHTRPDGTSWSDLGYYGVTSSGENIAWGYSSAQSVFTGWAEEYSPYDGQGHRRNMLSGGFTAIGIACFYYNGSYYWVQEFGWSTSDLGEDPSRGTLTGGLRWQLEDGLLTISGRGDMDDFRFSGSAPWSVDAVTAIKIEEGVTSIGNHAFSGCLHVTDVEIPSSVTRIGEYAFSHCGSLTGVRLPERLKEIGNGAFYWCHNIQTMVIPNGVPSIGEFTFYNCRGLSEITLGKSLERIGWYALYGTDDLRVKFSSGRTEVQSDMFGICRGIVSVEIPEGVTTIQMYAFSECEELVRVVIPRSVAVIGDYAFSNCRSLENVEIPEGVIEIGYGAFSRCESLTDVVIPDSVTKLGSGAFDGCTGLRSLRIGKNVTELYSLCSSCDNLTRLTVSAENPTYYSAGNCVLDRETNVLLFGCAGSVIPEGTVGIARYAFMNCAGLTKLVIPMSVTFIGEDAFSCCNDLTSLIVADGNPKYYSDGNCVFDLETGVLLFGCAGSVIPEGVTVIGEGAFSRCEGLTKLVIPSSVTTIEPLAFYGCSELTSIELPDSVTFIGAYAFYDCYRLTSIHIPSGLTSIEHDTFGFCAGLKSIKIPNSVKEIGFSAFFGTGLMRIEIPESVEIMERDVFDECASLKAIYCLAPEQPEGWDDGWLGDSKATVHWGTAMPPLALGDLDGDEEVSATDYMLLKRAVLGTYVLIEEQKAAADLNGDGEVNATDYMLLKRAVLGTYVIG